MTSVTSILEGRSGELWSVSSDQSVLDAIRLMAQKGVGAVLVMDDGHLSGILSERDYARKVILEDRSSRETRVSEIMTRDVFTTAPDASVADCMTLMTDNDFRHLPVVDGDSVVGMISIGDLVRTVIKEQQFTIEQLEHYITG